MSSRRGISAPFRVGGSSSMRSSNSVEQVARRRAGPGPASGWYCTLKAGTSRQRMPSTTPSLRFRWVTSAPLGSEPSVDRVVVVLAGDLDRAGRQAAHRVVAAVVAERAACRSSAAEGGGQQLVAEADAEHRHLAEQAGDGRRRVPATAAGSPGPLERNTPSGSRASTSAAGVPAGHHLDGGDAARGGAGSCA